MRNATSCRGAARVANNQRAYYYIPESTKLRRTHRRNTRHREIEQVELVQPAMDYRCLVWCGSPWRLHVVEEQVGAHQTVVGGPDLKELTGLGIISSDSVLVVDVQCLLIVHHAEGVLNVAILEVLDVGAVVLIELHDHLAGVWASHVEVAGLGVGSEDQTIRIVHLFVGELGLEGAGGVLELDHCILMLAGDEDVFWVPTHSGGLWAYD